MTGADANSITQRRFLWGRLDLTIEGDDLRVSLRKRFSLSAFSIKLKELDPSPVRQQQTPVAAIVCSFIFTAITTVFIVAAIVADDGDTAFGLGCVALICLIVTLCAAAIARKERVNVVSFFGPGGSVHLWHNLPDPDRFEAFVARLQGAITDAKRSDASGPRSVLRRLHAHGILNDWQYKEALDLFGEDEGQS